MKSFLTKTESDRSRFSVTKIMATVGRRPPNERVECRWGMKKLRLSINISLYLGNDTR